MRRTQRAGWFLWLRVAALAGMTLWLFGQVSSPSRDFLAGAWYFGAAFLLGAAYLGHFLWARMVTGKEGDRRPLRGPSLAVWLIEPGIFLFALTLCAQEVPLKARFSLNRPALEAYARQVQQSRVSSSEHRVSVGSFAVYETERLDNGEVRMIIGPCGMGDACGFVFSPGGRPRPGGENSFRSFVEPWYIWHRSW